MPIGSLLFLLTIGFANPAFAIENGMAEPSIASSFAGSFEPTPVEITANGTWFEFSFENNTTNVKGCPPSDPLGYFNCSPSSGTPTEFAPSPEWEFECLEGGCRLTVTDAFLFGDIFEVFDHSISIGTTSQVEPDIQNSCGSDPEICLVNPNSSSEIFYLEPGSHSLTMKPTVTVLEGIGYFKIEQMEPEIDSVENTHPVSGELLTINSSSLIMTGLASNMIWIIPIGAGITGAGIYLARSKFNLK